MIMANLKKYCFLFTSLLSKLPSFLERHEKLWLAMFILGSLSGLITIILYVYFGCGVTGACLSNG